MTQTFYPTQCHQHINTSTSTPSSAHQHINASTQSSTHQQSHSHQRIGIGKDISFFEIAVLALAPLVE
jgi:hypothetical protein